ncbi:hypothetical protein GS503_21665 [Rhodococcus hoagii]|nr:hypothetical protein [Prescottella equi]NKR71631.1 hypothetical protein [Prescottella equi]
MSRIHDVVRRYDACRAVLRSGVEIFAVGDPAGAQLNAAVRRALFDISEESKDVWDDLLRVASALRWRRMTQPQPNAYSPALLEAVAGVEREVKMLRHFVADETLLDQIGAAATAVGETDSPVGAELLRCIEEVGAEQCVVVASNGPARAGLAEWLEATGVVVVVPSKFDVLPEGIDQSYVAGPPAFFPSMMTAPPTEAVAFVMPAWYGNRSVPTSTLAAHAEGRIMVRTKVYEIGNVTEPVQDAPEEVEDSYFPQPVWGRRTSEDREPEPDEVEAWKVLLARGLALWIDDGERIRSLDPHQPEGDRVSYEAVADVRPGTYLVLREGVTERGAMYDAALSGVGDRAPSIRTSQLQWKQALAERLAQDGAAKVARELTARGVRSASRVRAWTEPTLVCPKHEENLALLLEWLDIPLQPSYENALTLRKALYKASADLRRELEDTVGRADLRALERDGFMHLDVAREGLRGLIVAKVLARAPFTEIVPRTQTRVPFLDGDAQWLE